MLTFKLLHFDELTTRELYELLRTRQEVFILEQNCPYMDLDGKDYVSHHLIGYNEAGETVAYCRIIPAGVTYPDDVCIGRVVCSLAIRKTGAGFQLMQEALRCCRMLYPTYTIRISAQTYLLKFYGSLGFISTGKEYLEDNIPHTEMYIN